jgi:hypothetical protein
VRRQQSTRRCSVARGAGASIQPWHGRGRQLHFRVGAGLATRTATRRRSTSRSPHGCTVGHGLESRTGLRVPPALQSGPDHGNGGFILRGLALRALLPPRQACGRSPSRTASGGSPGLRSRRSWGGEFRLSPTRRPDRSVGSLSWPAGLTVVHPSPAGLAAAAGCGTRDSRRGERAGVVLGAPFPNSGDGVRWWSTARRSSPSGDRPRRIPCALPWRPILAGDRWIPGVAETVSRCTSWSARGRWRITPPTPARQITLIGAPAPTARPESEWHSQRDRVSTADGGWTGWCAARVPVPVFTCPTAATAVAACAPASGWSARDRRTRQGRDRQGSRPGSATNAGGSAVADTTNAVGPIRALIGPRAGSPRSAETRGRRAVAVSDGD